MVPSKRLFSCMGLSIFFCCCIVPAACQIPDLPIPQAPHKGIHRDAAALLELTSYVAAVRDLSWTDLTGSGTITRDYRSSTEQGAAQLWLLGNSAYRLDTTVSGKQTSVRSGPKFSGSRHDGFPVRMLNLKELTAGFLIYPSLRVSMLADPNLSVLDGGTVDTAAGSLHRITIERPFPQMQSAVNTDQDYEATHFAVDLYFDPKTHLLNKSVVAFSPHGALQETMPLEITYADYRLVGGSLIPFNYSQSVNRQHTWTIQLETIKLSTGIDIELFSNN